jgi:hypothetical protein
MGPMGLMGVMGAGDIFGVVTVGSKLTATLLRSIRFARPGALLIHFPSKKVPRPVSVFSDLMSENERTLGRWRMLAFG